MNKKRISRKTVLSIAIPVLIVAVAASYMFIPRPLVSDKTSVDLGVMTVYLHDENVFHGENVGLGEEIPVAENVKQLDPQVLLDVLSKVKVTTYLEPHVAHIKDDYPLEISFHVDGKPMRIYLGESAQGFMTKNFSSIMWNIRDSAELYDTIMGMILEEYAE